MTGPLYPPKHDRSDLPGGQRPLGVPFDYWTTILSQYANSPALTTLVANLASYLDQTKNLDAFYDLIWNIDTAQGYGLDVWGRIVGINRVLTVQAGSFFGFQEAFVPNSLSITSFNDAKLSLAGCLGFAEALPGDKALGEGIFHPLNPAQTRKPADDAEYGPFYQGVSLTTNYRLSDEAYRTLIFAKAAANITDGSIPAINQILLNLFPNRGNCYVTEVKPTSYFGFAEAAVTRPTYVRGFNSFKAYAGPYFGFAEGRPGDDSLGQEPFYSGTAVGQQKDTNAALCAPFSLGQPNPYMAMTYTFEFPLTPVELAIVQQSGVLPKPTGVSATVVIH